MDRSLRTVALLLVVMGLGVLDAKAQNCGPWLNVKAWQVHYTFNLTGSGVGIGGLNYALDHKGSNLNQQKSDKTLLNKVNVQCPVIAWGDALETTGLGSANDAGKGTCGVKGIITRWTVFGRASGDCRRYGA